MKGIWAVVYGNYLPYELDSIWKTREAAERRVREILGGDGDPSSSLWTVVWIPFEEEVKNGKMDT